MTTITINERTKAGKIVLELALMLSVSNKGVAIETSVDVKPVSIVTEDAYDPKFVAMIKKRIAKDKFTVVDTESIWEGIK